MPKSPILINLLEVRKILADLRSRCKMFLEWRALMPITNMTNQAMITFSSISYPFFLAFLTKVARSPTELHKSGTFAELHDDDQIFIIGEALVVFYNKGVHFCVTELLQDFYLSLIWSLLRPWQLEFRLQACHQGSSSWRLSICH